MIEYLEILAKPEVVGAGVFTLLGAFAGAYLAGRMTLKATEKQIKHYEEEERIKKKENFNRTLVVVKSYLGKPISFVKEFVNDPFLSGFNQFNGDFARVAGINDDLDKAKEFIMIQAYNIDSDDLNNIYRLIESIENIINILYKSSIGQIDSKINEQIYFENFKESLDKLNF